MDSQYKSCVLNQLSRTRYDLKIQANLLDQSVRSLTGFFLPEAVSEVTKQFFSLKVNFLLQYFQRHLLKSLVYVFEHYLLNKFNTSQYY